MIHIAVLGPRGTFSDLAVDALDIASIAANKEKIYCKTIREVIEKVAKGEAKFGLVPFENNLYGTVRETEDTLFEYAPHIQCALEMPIHHALMAIDPMPLEQIEKIFSHQQGIEQCSEFVQKNCPKAQAVIVNSTGLALDEIQKERGKAAAIGSKAAIKDRQFTILAENIENHPDNMTTFFLVTKDVGVMTATQKTRTLIVFWFNENQPGTLHEVLGIFAERKINLTKIESRPYPAHPGEYIFFLEFEGTLEKESVQSALQNIQKIVAGLKNFGSYEVLRSTK